MKTILIIEDDQKICAELKKLLSCYGYGARCLNRFENTVAEALSSSADLILLDLNLPFADGYHVCREIRKQSGVPILVLTSTDSDLAEIRSIDLGADDFITKPFNAQVLLARIGALLRRAGGTVKTVNGVSLDLNKGEAGVNGKTAPLTKNEQRILAVLMDSAGAIVTRERLATELWQTDEFVDDNTLTVNINRLRAKLAEIGAPDFILTKRGQGYLCGF